MSAGTGARQHGHRFNEAFMVMQYRCEACGTTERLWNSRDGITPFTINCRSCGGSAAHVRWGEDVYAPDHRPALGERIFVDLNAEKALQGRLAFVDQWWDGNGHSDLRMRDHPLLGPMGKVGAAAHLAREDVGAYGGGSPDVIEVDEAARAWLAAQEQAS